MTRQLGTCAAIGWTSTGTEGERLHQLAVPLRDVVPAAALATFTAESLDRRTIHTTTVGSPVPELTGLVRFDDQPQSLLDMLVAGNQGKTLTYYPDLRDPGVSYPCVLVAPRGAELATALDAGTGAKGHGSVGLRLRPLHGALAGGATFHPLHQATATLLWYRAGDSFAGHTFARSGTATYVGKTSVGATAASGVARLEYADLDNDGVRETPGLLLEQDSTNICPDSNAFNSAWTADGTPVFTTSQGDPFGGLGATLIEDNDGGGTEQVSRVLSVTGDGTKTFSVFVKAGSATAFEVGIYDGTAATWRHRITGTWTAGVPVLTTAGGSGTRCPVERYANGWWRVMATAPGVLVASTNRLYLIPAVSTGTTYFYGAQVEEEHFPSSYVATSGGTAARGVESLTAGVTWKPQAFTAYVRFVERGAALAWRDARLLDIGGTAAGLGGFYLGNNGSNLYMARVGNATDAATSTLAVAPTYGQLVELVATVTSAGAITISQSINGATATSGSTDTVVGGLPSAWATVALYLGGLSTYRSGQLLLNAAVVRGVRSLADMRRAARI